MQALDGIKVVEISQVWAGPGLGMYLADQGADVVKIEPLWGDDARTVLTQPPMANGESRAFQVVNRNKRGVALDIASDEGRDAVHRMVKSSDVFIHNFRPGVEIKLGYDYDTLSHLNPGLIYAELAAYGKKGPYSQFRGYDLLFQALSGLLTKRRAPDGTPMSSGIWAADCSLPMGMAYGVALALLARQRTGRGQKVEASLLHMALAMQSVDMVRVENEAANTEETDFSKQALYSPYQCSDGGYVILVVLNTGQFHQLCKAMELEHLLDDPRYRDNESRAQNSEDLYSLIDGIMSTRPREEWLETFRAFDVPSMPILDRNEVFDHPQMTENEMFASVHHPEVGRVDMFNVPVRLSETPGAIKTRAPLLGEHTEEVLRELGYSEAETSELRAKGVIPLDRPAKAD